jgi:hypothetical protein
VKVPFILFFSSFSSSFVSHVPKLYGLVVD